MSHKFNRRNFFKMAATGGVASALAGCASDPVESMAPYLVPPDDFITGSAYHFSTICQECSAQCGMVVKTREGRAIHVEGNPNHPLSQGALCTIGNSTLQETYSPARLKGPVHQGSNVDYERAGNIFREWLEANRGRILYVGNGHSGSYRKLAERLMDSFGGDAVDFDLTPVDDVIEANRFLFGLAEIPQYKIDRADVLLSFGADFLESWLVPTEHSKSFSKSHGYKNGSKSKFHHFGPRLSLTASNADHWHAAKSGSESLVAAAMVNHLLPKSNLPEAQKRAIRSHLGNVSLENAASRSGIEAGLMKKIADSFGTDGKGLALAGGCETQNEGNEGLQTAVQLLNLVGGSVNRLVVFGADYKIGGSGFAKFARTLNGLRNGRYDLVILDRVNVLHALPESFGLKETLAQKKIVALSTVANETTRLSNLVLPVLSSVESWGDSNPRRGVFGLAQPAMAPVPGFDAVDAGDLMLKTIRKTEGEPADDLAASHGEYVKNEWRTVWNRSKDFLVPFETFWKKSLQKGGYFEDYVPEKAVLRIDALQGASMQRSEAQEEVLRLVIFNSSLQNVNGHTGDRTWLLEIPHPLTQAVWDSWAEMHYDTAEQLGVEHGDEIEIEADGKKLKLSAYVYHGVAPGIVAIPGGMGRGVLFPNYSQRRNMLIPFTADKPKELKTIRVGENPMDLVRLSAEDVSGTFPFAGAEVKVQPTGIKSDLVTLDGSWRDDIEMLASETRGGYGDRGQKGRGLYRAVDLDKARQGDFELEGHHHLRERKYTVDRVNNSSFYKDMEEVPKEKWLGTRPERQSFVSRNLPFRDERRFGSLHGMQRLRRRLLFRKQHPRRRKGKAKARQANGLDSDRKVFRQGRKRRFPHQRGSFDVPTLFQRRLRAGLSRLRHLPQPRRSQRPSLQPLRRHALLRQQLHLQATPFQLANLRFPLPDESPAQPRRHRSQQRRHGKMHLLLAPHSGGKAQSQAGKQGNSARRGKNRLPEQLPHRRHRLRQRAGFVEPSGENQAGAAKLPSAGRTQLPSCPHLPAQGLSRRSLNDDHSDTTRKPRLQ